MINKYAVQEGPPGPVINQFLCTVTLCFIVVRRQLGNESEQVSTLDRGSSRVIFRVANGTS